MYISINVSISTSSHWQACVHCDDKGRRDAQTGSAAPARPPCPIREISCNTRYPRPLHRVRTGCPRLTPATDHRALFSTFQSTNPLCSLIIYIVARAEMDTIYGAFDLQAKPYRVTFLLKNRCAIFAASVAKRSCLMAGALIWPQLGSVHPANAPRHGDHYAHNDASRRRRLPINPDSCRFCRLDATSIPVGRTFRLPRSSRSFPSLPS